MEDPEGSYSQLVRMQEGAKQSETHDENAEESENNRGDLERATSQRLSTSNSTSNELRAKEEVGEGLSRRRKKVSIFRLFRMNGPEWPFLVLGSIGAVLQGLMFPVFGLLLSTAIKIFFEPPHQLRKDSLFWGLMMGVLGLSTLVALPVQNYFLGIAGGRLIRRIRLSSFKKVVHQEISWFDDPANSRSVCSPPFFCNRATKL